MSEQPAVPVAPEDLKGEALAAALDDAGLPKTGTADEKRASLAEPEPVAEPKPVAEQQLHGNADY
jgi:hypothetical protein